MYDIRRLNFFNTFCDIADKIKISKIIKKYDSNLDISDISKGVWYLKDKIKISNQYIQQEKIKFDIFGFFITREIDKHLANIALESINLFKNEILNYLGPEVRLDDIYFTSFDPGKAKKKSNSGFWHRDNCGHRLKIFACIEGDGSTPTAIVPYSNQELYSLTLNELFRQFKLSSCIKFKGSFVEFNYKKGDAAMFDTHLLHRGSYEHALSRRDILVIEFMNRKKSNHISGMAPCGPGSSRTGNVTFSKDAYEVIASSHLIDCDLICKLENGDYSYSIKNIKC